LGQKAVGGARTHVTPKDRGRINEVASSGWTVGGCILSLLAEELSGESFNCMAKTGWFHEVQKKGPEFKIGRRNKARGERGDVQKGLYDFRC